MDRPPPAHDTTARLLETLTAWAHAAGPRGAMPVCMIACLPTGQLMLSAPDPSELPLAEVALASLDTARELLAQLIAQGRAR